MWLNLILPKKKRRKVFIHLRTVHNNSNFSKAIDWLHPFHSFSAEIVFYFVLSLHAIFERFQNFYLQQSWT